MDSISSQLPPSHAAQEVDTRDLRVASEDSTEERDATARIAEQDAESTKSDTGDHVGARVDIDV